MFKIFSFFSSEMGGKFFFLRL